MTYVTPEALRRALEHRLLTQSTQTRISLDRLRRRVLFERIVARLQAAEPGSWVLKGGMALEVRLRDEARVTKDIDLGFRGDVEGAQELQERLVEAFVADPDGDRFVLSAGLPVQLGADGGGHLNWRVKVAASLGAKFFGGIQLDVSPRAHELLATDHVMLPNSLEFAGIPAPVVEIIDVNRHAAEKFHAMLRDFGDRENSRVRDLVDLVILREHDLLKPEALASDIRQVWAERDGLTPPPALSSLPESWPDRYQRSAADNDLIIQSYPEAVAVVERLWTEMFPTEES
ncbi:MAG: nucleotidyl transferase AbiEii/AbiGii toxin family protein [Geodermatophilaceae bacterium]